MEKIQHNDNDEDDDESIFFTGNSPHHSSFSGPSTNSTTTAETTMTHEMVRITGRYDWFDSSTPTLPSQLIDERKTKDDNNSTPRGRKFLPKFLPFKILQRRQALFRRLHQAKDFSWALTAIFCIPMGLILPPIVLYTQSHTHTLAKSSIAQWTILVAILLSLCTAFVFNRLLYRTRAGGTVGESNGDQARHLAAAILFIMAPLSILTLPLLYLVVRLHANISHMTRLDHVWVWILLICTIILIYNHVSKVWLLGRRKKHINIHSIERFEEQPTHSLDIDMTTAGRRILFKQLVVASLDILSRILRHKSFAITVSRMLIIQGAFIVAWATSVLHLLFNDTTRNNYVWIILSTWMGMWGSSILRRILGYIASGGVTLWLESQHNAVLARENDKKKFEKVAIGSFDDSTNISSNSAIQSANMYGVLRSENDDYDEETYDSDDNDDMIDDLVLSTSHSTNLSKDDDDFDGTKKKSSWFDPVQGLSDLSSSIGLPHNITLRTLFFGAVSLSLGSVALCATSAVVSRWMLQMLAKVNHKRSMRNEQVEENEFSNKEMFQPMHVGGRDIQTHKPLQSRLEAFALHLSLHYSDCGLGHVAAYVKSYRSASCDVMNRLVETDLTLLVVDDISAHLCASVSFVIAGLCTLFASFVFQMRRDNTSEEAKCIVLLVSFLLSFSLVDTVMEPLRVSILSIYVSLAFHPLALKHSFPLLYHRLHRIRKPSINLV